MAKVAVVNGAVSCGECGEPIYLGVAEGEEPPTEVTVEHAKDGTHTVTRPKASKTTKST